MEFKLSTSIWSFESSICWCASAYMTWFPKIVLPWCWLVTKRCWSHPITKKGQTWKDGRLCHQELDDSTKEVPPHGWGMLCTNLGHYAF
jgi:hypothetical protein